MGPLRLVLDTCTFVWLTSDPTRLSTAVASSLNEPGNELLLSDASVWEICLKWERGKLSLPVPPRHWCEEQALIWKLEALPIARSHLFRVVELPQHHRDPFDRLLVAQALDERLTVVTPDPLIHRYPVATLW